MGVVKPLVQDGVETEADKTDRIAREAELIAEAEAGVLAGDIISHDQFRVWSENLLAHPDQSHPPPL